MQLFNAFSWDFGFLMYLNLFEIAVWGYLIFNLAISVIRLHELKAYWQSPPDAGDNQPIAVKYLKRAGFSLAVIGVMKIIQALYILFTMPSFR
jgi:hypothetical protein